MEIKTPKEEEFVDGNDIHMNPDQHTTSSETTRSFRDFPPAHYTLKMKSFLEFLDSGLDKYKSNVFEAGGYTWKLCLYPKRKTKTEKDHISIYLSIVHKDKKSPLPCGWEVYAICKFFVYDHIQNKYLTIQDSKGEPFRFYQTKTKWGFDNFMLVETLKDTSNGYLWKDCCVLGAEVFVVKYNGSGECLSTLKDPAGSPYVWKISKFSAQNAKDLFSEVITVGGLKWKLWFFTRGNGNAKGKSISLFLSLADSEVLQMGKKIYAEYTFGIRDQLDNTKTFEKKATHWFSELSTNRGHTSFISLEDLYCKSAGYVVNDTIILEVHLTLISVCKKY